MKSWKTKQGSSIKRLISGMGNAYLISSAGKHYLVDTGSKMQRNSLSRNLKQEIQSPGQLDYLILTHTHYDHCQNAAYLKAKTKCRILLHQDEAEAVQAGYTPLPEGTNAFSSFLVSFGRRISRKPFSYTPFPADELLRESSLQLASGIRLFHTPGHTSGSLSVLIDEEIALVGDALFGLRPGRIFPPFADDTQTLMESWIALFDTSCDLFLPGHGSPIDRERIARSLPE